MKEYLFSLVCISLFCSVFGLLSFGGKGGDAGVRRVLSLVILIAVFAPLPGLISDLAKSDLDNIADLVGDTGGEDDTDRFIEGLEMYGAQYVNAEISRDVSQRFDAAESEISAIASFGMKDGALYLEKITVILSGKAIWKNPHEIEKYVEERYGCNCVSAIG